MGSSVEAEVVFGVNLDAGMFLAWAEKHFDLSDNGGFPYWDEWWPIINGITRPDGDLRDDRHEIDEWSDKCAKAQDECPVIVDYFGHDSDGPEEVEWFVRIERDLVSITECGAKKFVVSDLFYTEEDIQAIKDVLIKMGFDPKVLPSPRLYLTTSYG